VTCGVLWGSHCRAKQATTEAAAAMFLDRRRPWTGIAIAALCFSFTAIATQIHGPGRCAMRGQVSPRHRLDFITMLIDIKVWHSGLLRQTTALSRQRGRRQCKSHDLSRHTNRDNSQGIRSEQTSSTSAGENGLRRSYVALRSNSRISPQISE